MKNSKHGIKTSILPRRLPLSSIALKPPSFLSIASRARGETFPTLSNSSSKFGSSIATPCVLEGAVLDVVPFGEKMGVEALNPSTDGVVHDSKTLAAPKRSTGCSIMTRLLLLLFSITVKIECALQILITIVVVSLEVNLLRLSEICDISVKSRAIDV